MGASSEALIFQNVESGNRRKALIDGFNLMQIPTNLFLGPCASAVTVLDISNNKLVELPANIQCLASMQYLYACGNYIKVVSPQIKHLKHLKVVDLSRNCLEVIPYEFSYLKQLTYLNLSGNELRSIPKFVLSLPKLKRLFALRNVKLMNIPRSIVLQGLDAMRIFLKIEIEKLPFVISEDVIARDISDIKPTDTELIVSELVRLFSEQLKLVHQYRNNLTQNSTAQQLKVEEETMAPSSKCNCRKLDRPHISSTSEYGTSSMLEECTDNISDGCCYGDNTSDWTFQNDSLSSSIEFYENIETDFACDLADYAYMNAFQELVLASKGVTLTVPRQNMSGHNLNEFTVDILDESSYFEPVLDSWSKLASPIVHLGPHGAKFYSDVPAVIKIPIGIVIDDRDIVECFTSDTDITEVTQWQKLDVGRIHVAGTYVQVEVTHFSLFAIVVSKPRPKCSKKIGKDVGGALHVTGEIGLTSSLFFPEEALVVPEIDASIELLYYDTFYVSQNESDMNALACPIVSLGPNGCIFKDPVSVTLPLPKGKAVKEMFKNASLTFMCSQTPVGAKPNWKRFNTEFAVDWNQDPCTVTFKIGHFTLFSVFWNILDVTLPEHLKLHASLHVPHFSFWVYFQALMTEVSPAKNVGLCVLCHRFEYQFKKGLAQYPFEVGMCKPRKVKTGKLSIQLRSGMFDADESVGERSNDMEKAFDFTGHEFDIHFACKFISATIPDRGLFGKVEICSADSFGTDDFSFNLILGSPSTRNSKECSGLQAKALPSMWESKMTKELAGLLNIDEHMWQELALALGYNRVELQTKFANSAEPIAEMLADFMGRGGEPDEFMNAMYRVARTFKLLPLNEMQENQQNQRLEWQQRLLHQNSSGTSGSNSKHCACPINSFTAGKRKWEALTSTKSLSESQFDDIAGEISKHWKSVGRKLNVSERELREIDLNYQNSGEKEKAFQMLLAWRETDPEHCVSGALYTVLYDVGLKYTAGKCSL